QDVSGVRKGSRKDNDTTSGNHQKVFNRCWPVIQKSPKNHRCERKNVKDGLKSSMPTLMGLTPS
ncbi:MAG: hypothetical protein OXC53_04370, partial [Rhodobacteraceae bacterium]|nr:hypothetical protein [Paracoccaceae bacterium]